MATRFFPRMALAAIGPGPGWWRPPKTRTEKAWYVPELLHFFQFYETLDRENHEYVIWNIQNYRLLEAFSAG